MMILILTFSVLIFLFFFSSPDQTIDKVSNFGSHIDTILDCWLLYQVKAFKDPDFVPVFRYFPLWNASADVYFISFPYLFFFYY